jgi:hypothetical protein
MTPVVGDHIRFTNKRRNRYEYGTVLAISKQSPQVFHVQDHNPLLDASGDRSLDSSLWVWRHNMTVHAKRIDRILPAGVLCHCGHTQCPSRPEYERLMALLREVVKGDRLAIRYEAEKVVGSKTEEELQGHLDRLRKLEQNYNVLDGRVA